MDNKETTNHIVDLIASEFPLATLLVRAYDREHSLHLIKKNVDDMVRETFESAMTFGRERRAHRKIADVSSES